jgi:VWFA-related protein
MGVRHAWLAVAAAVALAGAPAATVRQAVSQERPQSTFRSGASAVAVDVTVRDRSRRAITGLKAGDFQVFDNGVPQQVDDASYGKLPIDVTVALDVSYSVTGNLLDRLRQGVTELMRDLGRQDRLKLMLFNMRVSRTMDFTTDVRAVERAIRGAAAGGGTALLDAMSVALVSASSPDRRQLIVVFTDGNDSSSTTSPAMLTDVAQRTRGTLAFVMPSATLPVRTLSGPSSTITVASVAGALPRQPLAGLFNTLARETGGAILPVGPAANLSATFRQVLSEFRSAYVLYYTARGVDRSGYHAIEVKVTRDGAQVQARRGYFSP